MDFPILRVTVLFVDSQTISVDSVIYNIHDWLRTNEHLWFSSWDTWRKSIALCSRGDFHWTDNLGEKITYRQGNNYLNFVQWKKECYIRPSYELLPNTEVYKFLHAIWAEYNIPLGLVHPKGLSDFGEHPITYEFIRNMYDSPDIMCCQPYVVAGKLLNVPIYE